MLKKMVGKPKETMGLMYHVLSILTLHLGTCKDLAFLVS